MHHSISGPLAHATAPPGRARCRDDRGDVPGWVMVTLMTAAVVAVLTPFVSQQLLALLRQAFTMVGG